MLLLLLYIGEIVINSCTIADIEHIVERHITLLLMMTQTDTCRPFFTHYYWIYIERERENREKGEEIERKRKEREVRERLLHFRFIK